MIARWTGAVNTRYVLLAVGFAVLAAMRVADGAALWGSVFAAASAINVWLAVHERPRPSGGEEPAPSTPMPSADELTLSWRRHRGSLVRWRVLACVAIATGAGLLAVDPALSVLAAATALLCLFRARRARRDTTTLRRALDAATASTETPVTPSPARPK